MNNLSVIIPVYENKDLFLKNLALNKKYLDGCEIIIVNDSPTTSIDQEVKTIFNKAILIKNEKNLGFAASINKGVQASTSEYLMFLNTDVILQNSDYLKALNHFDTNPKLFAVSFSQENQQTTTGSNSGKFVEGVLQHKFFPRHKLEPNLWAEGGSMLCKKNVFLQLGGFEELYCPFYWEDIDLSYRAWKSDYTVLFDPGIQVLHQHETTIGKYFSQQTIKTISYRNSVIFHLMNLTDFNLICQNYLFTGKNILLSVIRKDWPYVKGFWQAMIKLPVIIKIRKQRKSLFILSDQEVLEKFKNE